MPEEKFCSNCRKSHPVEEMKQVSTGSGRKVWKCLKAIAINKKSVAERDEFGRSNSKANLDWTSDKPRIKP